MTLLFLPDRLEDAWHTPEHTYLTDEDKALLGGSDLTVILPGQSVRILPHDLPTLRARDRDSAARFFVEPLVGESVDDVHMVVGPSHVALISRARMAKVMDALAAYGIVPSAIHADHDVLPPATLPDRIVLNGATVDHGFPLDVPAPEPMGFAEIAPLVNTAEALDLLTGPYARRRLPMVGADTGWLKTAAGLVAAMGLGFLLMQFAEGRAERMQVEDLRERARDAYFATTGTESDTPARDAARLVEAPDAPGALDLMAVLFAALKDVDGVGIESLEYSERTGALDLTLAYPGFGATSRLEDAVNRAGARLQAGGVREIDGRFIGNATLSRRS